MPGADADLVRVVKEVEVVEAQPITAENNFRVALNCTDLEPITWSRSGAVEGSRGQRRSAHIRRPMLPDAQGGGWR